VTRHQPVPATLPTLPDTLVGLTSVSAAGYVAKKAIEKDLPEEDLPTGGTTPLPSP